MGAVAEHGDDWETVAQAVGKGRIASDCLAKFLAMPIQEGVLNRFSDPQESVTAGSTDRRFEDFEGEMAEGRAIPTVFSDVSNPLLGQVALFGKLLEQYGLNDEEVEEGVEEEED